MSLSLMSITSRLKARCSTGLLLSSGASALRWSLTTVVTSRFIVWNRKFTLPEGRGSFDMKTTRTAYCSHPECREVTIYSYDSKREARESTTDFRNWKCVRHSNPEKVLGVDNLSRTATAVATHGEHTPNKLYWTGAGILRSGFISGPGFKVFANDFPAGTTLTVTATIKLPQ